MTIQTPPDSWRLFAEWLPNLAPRRWQDREVFEHSNKQLDRVSEALTGVVRCWRTSGWYSGLSPALPWVQP